MKLGEKTLFRQAPHNACCQTAINRYPNKKHLLKTKPVNAFDRVAVVACRYILSLIKKWVLEFNVELDTNITSLPVPDKRTVRKLK